MTADPTEPINPDNPTVLPAMLEPQEASWHGLMDLYDRIDTGWTLVGGQLVHLHCAERDFTPLRPTSDIDAVLDVRENPQILLEVTSTLVDLDFAADGISADGAQHRWKRGDASIDVLIPTGVGERAAQRTGVTGSRTIETPGGTQALQRSETVAIRVGSRGGLIRRPNLVGALVMKAATLSIPVDPAKGRHRSDFALLAQMVAASDFRDADLSKGDRKYLRAMVAAVQADPGLADDANAMDGINRLVRAAALG